MFNYVSDHCIYLGLDNIQLFGLNWCISFFYDIFVFIPDDFSDRYGGGVFFIMVADLSQRGGGELEC